MVTRGAEECFSLYDAGTHVSRWSLKIKAVCQLAYYLVVLCVAAAAAAIVAGSYS
jgi:hypothetical protein